MDDEKKLRRRERRSKRKEERKERRSKRKEERRSRKSKRKEKINKLNSRFAGKDEEKTLKEKVDELSMREGLSTAQALYRIERENHDHTITARTPSRYDRASLLKQGKERHVHPANPERSTYTVSRTEFQNSIQEMKDSMTKFKRDMTESLEDLQYQLRKTKKEAMLKSIYSYVIVNGNIIVSYGGSELLLSPKYFYLTDKIMTGTNNINILDKFPNVRSIYLGSINSPIDFRGLERIESLTTSSITVPIDLTPLINLKYISFNGGSYSNSLDNIREGLKNLNKLKLVSAPTPLTPTQLLEYGIRYDTSRHSERDDILKDYTYDDEDYEDESTLISVGRRDRLRDGAGLPS